MIDLIAAPLAYAPLALPPYAVPSRTILTLRLANAGYTTGQGDDPANTLYRPALMGDIEVSCSAVNALGIGGRVALGVAQVEVDDATGSLLPQVAFGTADGRRVTIRTAPVSDRRAGNYGTALGSAPIAFAGVMQRIEHAPGHRARLTITDASERLAVRLQPARFAGTGGLEGPATLGGRPKPVALGVNRNVSPVPVGDVDLGDGDLQTYVVHSAAVQDITAVRIRGVEQTIVGTAPGVGEARVWTASGAFQIGASPDGAVTCDVVGDASAGAVASTSGILQILLTEFGPALPTTSLNLASFAQADTDLPGDVGVWQPAEETTAAAVADRILAGCGAVLTGGRDGRVRLVDLMAAGDAQFTLDLGRILSIAPVDLPAALRPLPWVVAIDYDRNNTEMTDFAGAVTDADRARLSAATQGPARAESSSISAWVAQQREMRLPGVYANEADALARAQRIRTWLETPPRLFRVQTDRYLGQIEVGDLGAIGYPGYGLAQGAGVVVLAYRETLAARRLELVVATVPWVTIPPAAAPGVFFVLDEDLLA
jgi:hypothetical protein